MSATSDAVLEVALGGIENVGVSTLRDNAKRLTLNELREIYGEQGFREVVKTVGNASKEFAIKQAKEAVQEGAEEVVQDLSNSLLTDQILLGKEFNLDEFSDQSVRTFFQSAAVAAIMNGGQNSLNVVSNGVRMAIPAADIKNILSKNVSNDNISAAQNIRNYLVSNVRKYAYANTNNINKLNDDISNNGLYHFTSNPDAILNSGKIKSSDMISSYGNRKTFMF